MFKTGGTSAYGKGITSNLVSDEQRQRFNYGGRVRAAHGLPHYRSYTDRGQQYATDYMPQSQEDWRKLQEIQVEGLPYKTIEEINREVEESVPGQKRWYDFTDFQKLGESAEDYTSRISWEKSPEAKEATRKELLQERQTAIKDLDPDLIARRKEVGLYTPGISADQPLHQEFETPVVEEEEEKVVVEEPGYETGEHWEDLASKMPGKKIPGKEEPTDVLDVDKWAFLDEQQKAKQKLARGYGLTEAAAAAAKWSTAGTAKERSAAISEGLSKVGAIGAKYKGEATDLKTKAKILGTVEEIKGEQKQKLWQDRLKGYYQPTLDIAEQGLALKKAAVELAAEGKDGLSIYDDILLTDSKSLRDPFTKRDILRSLTGKNLQVEGEKNKKTLNSKENKGLIFIDIQGNVVRNKGDGTTEDVDETRDEFFTWRN
jgi:hypothetical protein